MPLDWSKYLMPLLQQSMEFLNQEFVLVLDCILLFLLRSLEEILICRGRSHLEVKLA